jgi:exodeoxyribonuclease VII large subunit
MADTLNIDITSSQILSVSELNRMVRDLLERNFPLFWISGEISNLTRAASGHWYFSLKDSKSQIRCVMFRGKNSYLNWTPMEGDKVEARANVTLYEARGDFQLTIEFLQRAGLGALFEAFEKLKLKLQAEGLFDEARKREIPAFPRQIGIVTSADAAALHDVLTTLRRRMPSIPVIIYPTPVQGKGAAELIASAIDKASRRAECDVLIVCRGGGSIEDLWQFNEEIVARAIVKSSIPVISGVGHETDFTIADFAADRRAPTPTAAAELASPSREALLTTLIQRRRSMERSMRYRLQHYMQQLDFLGRRLLSPSQQLAHKQENLMQISMRLQNSMKQQLSKQQEKILRLSLNLKHLNPDAVLSRGYALIQSPDGTIVRSSEQVMPGDEIHIRFAEGSANAKIHSKNT